MQKAERTTAAAPITGRTFLFERRARTETAERVSAYFENSGFSRWTAIYGDGGIPPIWRVIREGHDRAISVVLDWIADDGSRKALDAGCGTGALAKRLSDWGYAVDGFDVSAPMVSYARYWVRDRCAGVEPQFCVGDIAALDAVPRSYDLVCCLDVLFHYPYEDVEGMLTKLADASSFKLIGSFAVRTAMNSFWMAVGQKFFHQKNRMTRLHLLSYDQVEQILYRAGFNVTRTRRVKRFFYDSFLFEAVRR